MEESRATLNRWKRLLEINSVDTDLARLVFSQEVENKREVYNSILRSRKVELNFLEMKALLQRLNADKNASLTALVEKVESLGGVESLQKPAPQPPSTKNYYAEYSDARNALNDLRKSNASLEANVETEKQLRISERGMLDKFESICRKYHADFVMLEKALQQYDPKAKNKPVDPLTRFPFGKIIPQLIKNSYPHIVDTLSEQCESADELEAEINALLTMLANVKPSDSV